MWYLTRRSVQQSENKITQTNEKVKRGKEEMAAEETVEIKLEKRSREPLSEVLGYRVTKEEAQEIREYAKRNGVNVPDVIRSSLRTTGVIGNEVKP